MTLPLGPHAQRPTPGGLSWAASAPIVKVIDDVTLLKAAPASAVKIFRHFDPYESSIDAMGTVNKLLAALGTYRDPGLYLQLWTGAHPSRAVLTAAVTYCHVLGYRTIGTSWYTGDYTQGDWDDATAAGVDAYGPQCYWGAQGFTIGNALRYRQFMKPGQKLLIPECGRDAIEGGKGGWLADGMSARQYAGELAAYAEEIAKDGGLATAFVVGFDPPWQNYELETVIPLLLPLLGGTVPTPVPAFNVGAGVLAEMARQFDMPVSDEQYKSDAHGTYGSETWGTKGIYRWVKLTGQVSFDPF